MSINGLIYLANGISLDPTVRVYRASALKASTIRGIVAGKHTSILLAHVHVINRFTHVMQYLINPFMPGNQLVVRNYSIFGDNFES